MHTIASYSSDRRKLLSGLFINSLLCLLLVFPNTAKAAEDQQATMFVTTASGMILEVFSELDPLQINIMHSWRVRLSKSGSPLSGASVTMSGGMPDHDHGLPTRAVVTEELEPGLYLLEGIRFHMPGRWQLVFSIEKDDNSEQAAIDFSL